MKCRRGRPFPLKYLTIDEIAQRLKNELMERTPSDLPDLTINITSFLDPSILEGKRYFPGCPFTDQL